VGAPVAGACGDGEALDPRAPPVRLHPGQRGTAMPPLSDACQHPCVGARRVPSRSSHRGGTPPVGAGPPERRGRGRAAVQPLALPPAIRARLRAARGGPPRPSADSAPGIREAYAALRPLPWPATARGTGEASRGPLAYRPCLDAGCVQHRPWVDGGLDGRGPARPDGPTPPRRCVSRAPHVRSTLPSAPPSR
jgi:hypothetical protein